jgi:hypothetical protein
VVGGRGLGRDTVTEELIDPVQDRPAAAGHGLVTADGTEFLGSEAVEPTDDL